MFQLFDDILIVNKNDSKYFFDPQSLIIFSKKKSVEDSEIIQKYKKSINKIKEPKKTQKRPFNSVCIELHVTNDCNLSCKYCFINEKCHLEKHKKMSDITIEKAFLLALKAYPSVSLFRISLFGGEPLLFAKKFEYIKDTAKRVFKDKKYSITFTTNGTIINNDILSFVKDNKISFQISWDGPKKQHDYLRSFQNKKGSFDIINSNFEKYKDILDNISVRSTITPHNMNLLEIFRFFESKGFKKISYALCSSSINELIIKNDDLAKLFDETTRLAEYYLQHIIETDSIIDLYPIKFYLQTLHFGQKKHSFCNSGKNLFSVATDGSLYSCHRLVENNEFKIGNIHEGFDESSKILKELKYFDVNNEKKCEKCFAKYSCGGGCVHEKFTSFDEISCQYMKHVLSLSIWLYGELQNKYPEALKKLTASLIRKSVK